MIPSNVSSFIQTSREEIINEQRKRAARRNYYDYVLYTNPGFIDTRFHRFLCTEIQNFLSHDVDPAFDILLISTPPQHGKSRSITETLPSWYLGSHPDKSVIIAGYSEDFAKRFGRRNLRKLEDYGPALFPNFRRVESPWTNTEFESEDGGRCISRGILSGITGNPANLVLIDDPTKNMQEAMSETTRAAILDEFYASILTRIAPKGKLIIIQTRWHDDDLFGHILKHFPNARVINLPCEAEENDLLGRNVGDALCPEIGKDNAWLKAFKATYASENGERSWNALYQGNPQINGGNLFLEDRWQFFDEVPEGAYRVLSVDATFKKSETSDFVSIQGWAKLDGHYYGFYNKTERMSFTEMMSAIREYLGEHYSELSAIYIEDKANGSAAIDMLSREFDNIIPVNPEGGKLSRAAAVSPLVDARRVHLKRGAHWVPGFIEETSKFPAGAHDDQVDAFSQALNRLASVNAVSQKKVDEEYSDWTDDMWEDYESSPENVKEMLLKIWKLPKEWRSDVA